MTHLSFSSDTNRFPFSVPCAKSEDAFAHSSLSAKHQPMAPNVWSVYLAFDPWPFGYGSKLYTTNGPQVLVHVFIHQGSMLGTFFDPWPFDASVICHVNSALALRQMSQSSRPKLQRQGVLHVRPVQTCPHRLCNIRSVQQMFLHNVKKYIIYIYRGKYEYIYIYIYIQMCNEHTGILRKRWACVLARISILVDMLALARHGCQAGAEGEPWFRFSIGGHCSSWFLQPSLPKPMLVAFFCLATWPMLCGSRIWSWMCEGGGDSGRAGPGKLLEVLFVVLGDLGTQADILETIWHKPPQTILMAKLAAHEVYPFSEIHNSSWPHLPKA